MSMAVCFVSFSTCDSSAEPTDFGSAFLNPKTIFPRSFFSSVDVLSGRRFCTMLCGCAEVSILDFDLGLLGDDFGDAFCRDDSVKRGSSDKPGIGTAIKEPGREIED